MKKHTIVLTGTVERIPNVSELLNINTPNNDIKKYKLSGWIFELDGKDTQVEDVVTEDQNVLGWTVTELIEEANNA